MRDVYYGSKRKGYATVPRTVGWVGHGEKKYFDFGVNAAAVGSAATWGATGITVTNSAGGVATWSLATPVQGAGINQRIGRKIKLHAIRIRGIAVAIDQAAKGAAVQMPTMRIMLVQNMQTNATVANGSDVIQNPTGGAAPLNAIQAFQNLATLGQFKVLKDKILSVRNSVAVNNAAAGTVSQTYNDIEFRMNKKFRKPVIIHFNATNAGTYADVVDHSFGLIALADSAASPGFNLTLEGRAYYTDE